MGWREHAVLIRRRRRLSFNEGCGGLWGCRRVLLDTLSDH